MELSGSMEGDSATPVTPVTDIDSPLTPGLKNGGYDDNGVLKSVQDDEDWGEDEFQGFEESSGAKDQDIEPESDSEVQLVVENERVHEDRAEMAKPSFKMVQ